MTETLVLERIIQVARTSHSGIRQQLGIGKHGAASLFHCISLIFEDDLMKLFHQRHAIMCFVTNDALEQGTLVPYPGSSARPDLFRLDVVYDPEEGTMASYPEARCLQLIRAAVGIPDLPVQLKAVLSYEAVALVADRFGVGRVLLVGDAARTQPPSGGLGGNTGIAEAYNLAWKLAAVLRGEAGEGLLATYDAERRRIADYTAEQAAKLSQERETVGSAGITVDIVIMNAGYRYREGCAGYLAHPFVKWMVLVLIAPFFSQLSFFTDEEVQEHFAFLRACSESQPLPQRRWQRERFFQALQKRHGGTQYAISSGSSASLSKRSSHSSVLVVEPTQDWNRDDPLIRLSGWNTGNFPFGNLLTDALMWSRPVEIRDVGTQHTMHLFLMEDQYVGKRTLAEHLRENVHTSHWPVVRDRAF